MRTTEEIYASLAEAFARASGTAPAEGGDMSLRLRAVAAELAGLEAQAEFVARQAFPQTAVGEYLDRHAQLRGLSRAPARAAEGILRFTAGSGREGTLTVPAGTRCTTAAGVSFVTGEEGSIPAESDHCDVAAGALEPGAGGNVPAGSVCHIQLAPAGITGVTNPAAFSGGADREEDEALRERVVASYRSLPNGANAAYYEKTALNIPGVAAAMVLPKNRGLGTVDVIVAGEEGEPSPELVEQVRSALEASREICVDIQVYGPETVETDVAAELTLAEGADFAAVAAEAESAVRGWFGGKKLGRSVYRARLCALLMGVEGVENCSLSAPAEDVAVAAGQLPVLGTLSISQAV